jgi:hypothetical protein
MRMCCNERGRNRWVACEVEARMGKERQECAFDYEEGAKEGGAWQYEARGAYP